MSKQILSTVSRFAASCISRFNILTFFLGSSYEECRAESVALHLSLDPRSVQIFGHSGEDIQHIKYISWLHMAHGGNTLRKLKGKLTLLII